VAAAVTRGGAARMVLNFRARARFAGLDKQITRTHHTTSTQSFWYFSYARGG
jgi:hypothetical protein